MPTFDEAGLAEDLKRILDGNGFPYYTVDDILSISYEQGRLELAKKAYGDSYSCPLENVFCDEQELEELYDIAGRLGISIPDDVYYD